MGDITKSLRTPIVNPDITGHRGRKGECVHVCVWAYQLLVIECAGGHSRGDSSLARVLDKGLKQKAQIRTRSSNFLTAFFFNNYYFAIRNRISKWSLHTNSFQLSNKTQILLICSFSHLQEIWLYLIFKRTLKTLKIWLTIAYWRSNVWTGKREREKQHTIMRILDKPLLNHPPQKVSLQ